MASPHNRIVQVVENDHKVYVLKNDHKVYVLENSDRAHILENNHRVHILEHESVNLISEDNALFQSLSSYSGSRRGSNDSTESDMSSKDSNDPKDLARKFKVGINTCFLSLV